MKFEDCTDLCEHQTITVSEKTGKFVLKNPQRKLVNKVTVEGCLMDKDAERCDFLFEICSPDKFIDKVYYVELKGSDIEKACDQLSSTLKYCRDRHGKSESICYIVASRVPQAGPSVQNLKAMFIRKFNVQLYVKNQVAEVKI
jgi:hypothetical protein